MDKKLKPSKTADTAIAARAWAAKYHENPVFRDELAFELTNTFWHTVISSPFLTKIVIEKKMGHLTPVVAAILTRAKFCEIEAENAAKRGINQFVMIGARYDTFAMRRQDLAKDLTVFEIDDPATQSEKRRRMKDKDVAEPENVKYVPLDVNRELLIDGLFRAGFDFSQPAVLSWMGASYYLPMNSITLLLKSIAMDMARGSQLMFDYLGTIDDTPEQWRQLRSDCEAFVAKKSEKWITEFKADELPNLLKEIGFDEIYNVAPNRVSQVLYDEAVDEHPAVFGICRAGTSILW